MFEFSARRVQSYGSCGNELVANGVDGLVSVEREEKELVWDNLRQSTKVRAINCGWMGSGKVLYA